MGLLKKKDKEIEQDEVALQPAAAAAARRSRPLRPRYVDKPAAVCTGNCPSGNDIRGWLTAISLREKLGLSSTKPARRRGDRDGDQPLPVGDGAGLPPPLRTGCNRGQKDGPVGINSVERSSATGALERGLKLEPIERRGPKDQKIAVVGAGPSGLSCAYQLARRGYKVTVFDAFDKPGGMLRYGIPVYRLPREVLDGEIQRILDSGVELKCDTEDRQRRLLDDMRKEVRRDSSPSAPTRARTWASPARTAPASSPAPSSSTTPTPAKRSRSAPRSWSSVAVTPPSTRPASRCGWADSPPSALGDGRRGDDPLPAHPCRDARHRARDRGGDRRRHQHRVPRRAGRDPRDDDGKLSRRWPFSAWSSASPTTPGAAVRSRSRATSTRLRRDTMIMAVSQEAGLATLGGGIGKGNWLEVDDWGRTGIEGVWSGGDNADPGTRHDLHRPGRARRRSASTPRSGRRSRRAPFERPR